MIRNFLGQNKSELGNASPPPHATSGRTRTWMTQKANSRAFYIDYVDPHVALVFLACKLTVYSHCYRQRSRVDLL